jgi:hypothetical protein
MIGQLVNGLVQVRVSQSKALRGRVGNSKKMEQMHQIADKAPETQREREREKEKEQEREKIISQAKQLSPALPEVLWFIFALLRFLLFFLGTGNELGALCMLVSSLPIEPWPQPFCLPRPS